MHSLHPKAEILGRLLILQQTLYILPDERSLSKFLAAAMLDVPGVASCKVSLQGTSEAGAVFDHEGAPVEIPIQTPRTVFGHIFLSLNDPEVFRAYQPVIENIGQVVATSLENLRITMNSATHSTLKPTSKSNRKSTSYSNRKPTASSTLRTATRYHVTAREKSQ